MKALLCRRGIFAAKAMPSLLAQAASPVLGALLMERVGADGALAALLGAAVLDVILVVALLAWMRATPAGAKIES